MDESNEYGQCDGMRIRILYHECFSKLTVVASLDEDVKDTFTFAYKDSGSFAEIEKKYPSISYIDHYGHTAIDGLSYAQLIHKDLPKLLKAATASGNKEVVSQINRIQNFIENNIESEQILVFDGM